MRIVFMGTPDFAVPSLRLLLDHSYDVAAVVTAPDKPRGRGQHVTHTPVKVFALERGLPILEPEDLSSSVFHEQLRAVQPDLVVVVAFRILPREVYTIPTRGSFNLHASLLPRYRGAAPINWAVMHGDAETGVTTFLLQDKVDTGSILLQRSVSIGPEDTAGIVHDRLSVLGAEVVLETVRRLEQGTVTPSAQDDSKATKAPKIFRENCRIDWSKPSLDVHNFIRGLSPVPCAWTTHEGRVLKVYRSRVVAQESSELPGSVVHIAKDELHISTGQGLVAVLAVQQEGKRRLPVDEFLRGYPFSVGNRFE